MNIKTEDGEVIGYYHVGTIDYQGKWYAYFQTTSPEEGLDADELAVFLLNDDGSLSPIEDDNAMDELCEIFMRECEAEDVSKCGGCGGCCGKKNNYEGV